MITKFKIYLKIQPINFISNISLERNGLSVAQNIYDENMMDIFSRWKSIPGMITEAVIEAKLDSFILQ